MFSSVCISANSALAQRHPPRNSPPLRGSAAGQAPACPARGGVAFRATGSANQTIQVHKLYNGEGWTESNVTYDNMGYSCGVVTTAELGNNAPTTFDLTSLVKQWINGTNVASNGFMMKGVNESTVNKAFCSTEYGTTDMRPYMALSYTPVTAIITPDDDFVKIGESQQFTCTTSPYDAEFTWMIRDANIATVTEDGLVTGIAQGQTYLTAMWNGGSLSVPIKVGVLEEGTYFIGNKGTGKYMDLESASNSDGAPIQQWAFHGQIQSRWIIAMESIGAYSIRSASSGKYIGVEDSSTIGNAAIKQYSSIANQAGRQWNISITSSGAYRFTPCSSSSMALAVPLSGTYDDGTDLVQLVYSDNTNYRDEWVVGVIDEAWSSYPITYLVNLDVLYDHAYLQRYPDAISRINTHLYALKDKYVREFGIYVNYSPPTIYTSFADANCPSHYTTGCECISDDSLCQNTVVIDGQWVYQTYHHNNVYNNECRVPFPDTDQTLRTVFFGRKINKVLDYLFISWQMAV